MLTFLVDAVWYGGVGKAKDAETLGVHVRKDIIAEIVARGDAIDKTKSNYAALILEKWFADGCPPVTEIDRLMVISRQGTQKKSTKKTG